MYEKSAKLSYVASNSPVPQFRKEELFKETLQTWRHTDSSATLNKISFFNYCNRTISSMIPDEVLLNPNNYQIRSFSGSVLSGIITGISELFEEYTKTENKGSSRLTFILNSYIGAILLDIVSRSGDVICVSGEGFTAFWKSTEGVPLTDTIREAIDSALILQKNHGQYKTETETVCKIKLGIAAGTLNFNLIGDEERSSWLLNGQPVVEAVLAGEKANPEEVIVAKAAYHLIGPKEYTTEDFEDGYHIKITGVGPNWKNYQRKQVLNLEPVEAEPEAELSEYAKIMMELDSIRPSIAFGSNKINEDLYKFLVKPVIDGILNKEPLDYLNEVRQITAIYINIVNVHLLTHREILEAAHKYFLMINEIGSQHNGCLIKASVKDKSFLYALAFGLRGSKSEMESQEALLCASKLYSNLNGMVNVISVAVSVTTGRIYCGIFGQTLRRDFALIGQSVSKAKKMTLAYPYKVTCDRSTFLHSRLKSQNFTIQPFLPLEGVKAAGPIYEFKHLLRMTHSFGKLIHEQPLLGRDAEVELFLNLLNEAEAIGHRASPRLVNLLIIEGGAMQGKSRLLEELIYKTPPRFPLITFRLRNIDADNPHESYRLVFGPVLGITSDSSQLQVEEYIKEALVHVDPNMLCCLNPVFKVAFKLSPEYVSLSQGEKDSVLIDISRHLLASCFREYWVIAIDNMEWMDSKSWFVIGLIIDMNLAFVVMTCANTRDLCMEAMSVMQHQRAFKTKLAGIDNKFLGGLICQLLKVEAIPPELERAVQKHSEGNPGWIDSFLISLTQGDGLRIWSLTRREAEKQGLIMPPMYQLVRMTEEAKLIWSKVMDEYRIDDFENLWKNFGDTLRDSFTNVHIRTRLESRFKMNQTIKVCAVNKHVKLEDIEHDLSLGTLMMQIFDELSSYERLMVKCASVLGECFLRKMMEYLMNSLDTKKTALTVAKLFEIKVFGCARGDFKNGKNLTSISIRKKDPSDDIVCECQGIIIPSALKFLPRYAFCGYLRFRSMLFRETTYNLLTENQKKDYHLGAARFLIKETRKCDACGGGFFSHILIKEADVTLKKKKVSIEVRDVSSLGSFHEEKNEDPEVLSSHLTFSTDSSTELKQIPSRFGFNVIRQFRDQLALVRTYSTDDFSACQCNTILYSLFTNLIKHYRGSGKIEELFDSMITCIRSCLRSDNPQLALNYLVECNDLLEDRYRGEPQWLKNIRKGKMESLRAMVLFKFGQDEEAHSCLKKALVLYGFPFPSSFTQRKILELKLRWCHVFRMFFCPDYNIGSAEGFDAKFSNDLSQTLSLLTSYFLKKKMFGLAELTASWSLVKALEAYNDFSQICSCYGDAIITNLYHGRYWLVGALEIYAIRLCLQKKHTFDVQELEAVGNMYLTIFVTKLRRSDLEGAVYMGYTVWRIGTAVPTPNILLRLFPSFIQILTLRNSFFEVTRVLSEFEYYVRGDWDSSGRIWYYSLCIGLHLESGYSMIPIEVACKYSQAQGTWLSLRDPDAKVRFSIVMWLWFLRTENYEASNVWYLNAMAFELNEVDSINNIFTGLYLLEGLLIFLVRKLDKRNLSVVMDTYKKINGTIEALERCSKIARFLEPRLLHLKAYYQMIKFNEYQAFYLVKKALAAALQSGNLHEYDWVNYSKMFWCNELPSNIAELWRDHADMDNVTYRDAEENGGLMRFFSLPTPLYL